MPTRLGSFLLESFRMSELRALVRRLPEGDQLIHELPDVTVAPTDQVDKLEEALSHRGLLKEPDLHVLLASERPRRFAEILAISQEHGAEIDWDRACERLVESGRSTGAAAIREELIWLRPPATTRERRVASLRVASLRAQHRTARSVHPSGEREETRDKPQPSASGRPLRSPDANWIERLRSDIHEQVMALAPERAALLLLDLARECKYSSRSQSECIDLAVRVQRFRRDRPDEQLLGEILEYADAFAAENSAGLPPADLPVVICNNLGKRYRESGDFELRGVSLVVQPGMMVGVVGPNGGGKSTLLRILCGEIARTTGTLSYPGLQPGNDPGSVPWHSIRRQIHYTPQRLRPWPGRLSDHLRAWASLHGNYGRNNDEEIRFAVARLGLEAHKDKTWDELSGGFRTRVELACVRISRPRLLVLDEPLAPLDIDTQEEVLKILRDFTSLAGSPAVMLSSQLVTEIEHPIDHLVCLNGAGQVSFSGSPERLVADATRRIFELSAPMADKLYDDIRALLPFCSLVRSDEATAIFTAPLDASVDQILAVIRVGDNVVSMREITGSALRLMRHLDA